MEGWWMAEEIKYKTEGNNNGTRFPSFDTQSANRDDIEAIFMYHRAPLPPPPSPPLLFVSNLRDGLTTGSINLLFTFAFALEIARGLF